MAGGPVRQPYAGVEFIPQSEICEFGYRRPWNKASVAGFTNILQYTVTRMRRED
jgi:hypothetical protein